MENKQMKRKWRIRPRILAMLLLLLAVIFCSTFAAFNLFINRYIESTMELQLDDLVNNFQMNDSKRWDKPPETNVQPEFLSQHSSPDGSEIQPMNSESQPGLPDITSQRKNRIGARGEVFILDSDYTVREYNEDGSHESFDSLKEIAAYMKEKNISLADAKHEFVDTGQGQYYISSVEDMKRPGSYLVFYMSVTGINNLVDTINISLAVIFGAAMLICFLIANVIATSVTRPVKILSQFAEEMGKSNFGRKDFSFRDIEFDELGEAMNRSAEKLDLYDRDQRAFFQNASHELRTPLMSIRCYAEGVECGLMDPKKSGATIISETDRLSELVEDLLYISRVDNITNHLEKSENDLRDTLSLCAEALKPVAVKNGLQLEYEFDEEPVLFVYNEKHMYRALSNLISNALRYARTKVILRCGRREDQIEILVMDDGMGISPEDMPRLFERFYKGKDGKHGIGLSIVKSVVELHGGTVSASSQQGASFLVCFPIR